MKIKIVRLLMWQDEWDYPDIFFLIYYVLLNIIVTAVFAFFLIFFYFYFTKDIFK